MSKQTILLDELEYYFKYKQTAADKGQTTDDTKENDMTRKNDLLTESVQRRGNRQTTRHGQPKRQSQKQVAVMLLFTMLQEALDDMDVFGIHLAIVDIDALKIDLRGKLADDLFNAKITLKALEYRKSLRDARTDAKRTGNTNNLRAVVNEFDGDEELQAGPQREIFKEDLEGARADLKRANRLLRIPKHRLDMNANSLLELRQYKKPVETVKKTVQALLLLLGHCEKQTEKWSRCQSLLADVFTRVHDFEPRFVDWRIAARSRQILDEFHKREIALHSAAAFAYYEWVAKTTRSIRETATDETFVPAKGKLQMRILRVTDEEEMAWI